MLLAHVERVEIHIRSFVLSRPRMLDLYRTYTYYLVKSIRVREGERMTPLLYEVEDGLAIVTLNRPDQMNATSPAMRELLIEATYRAETDDAVRAVLIRGAGEHFMAGGDLPGFPARMGRDTDPPPPGPGAPRPHVHIRFLALVPMTHPCPPGGPGRRERRGRGKRCGVKV